MQEKNQTTYAEVADEVVAEISAQNRTINVNTAPAAVRDIAVQELCARLTSNLDIAQSDEKNIRRRVYDALNVLMAMGIIKKQKKTILWVGLPQIESSSKWTSQVAEASELGRLRKERDRMRNVLMEKGQQQLELQMQERCAMACPRIKTDLRSARVCMTIVRCCTDAMFRGMRELIERNRSERHDKDTSTNSCDREQHLRAPFLIVQADPADMISADATHNQKDITLSLGRQCRIYTDAEIFRDVAQAASSVAVMSGSSSSLPAGMHEVSPPAPDRLLDATATAAAAAATTPVGASRMLRGPRPPAF